MGRRITINPITRLEGHGKIDIFLDDGGNVERAYFQVPEFRGFEKFCEGRAAEEMPALTAKICGVCPTAHHIASVKALDALYNVEPPPAARLIRELMYCSFIFEDHLLHFYFLGGPDLIAGPQAGKAGRNILGVLDKIGAEAGRAAMAMRTKARRVNAIISGSALYPVCGVAGGVLKTVSEAERAEIRGIAREAVAFAESTLALFDEHAIRRGAYADYARDEDAYAEPTYYMGLVDEKGRVNFYDGKVRVVGPRGKEFALFPARHYARHIEERVEPWNYMKFLYLKDIGWKGFRGGADSGVYRVAPLARLNAAAGMATPRAQAAYEQLFGYFGGKPVHTIMAYHWARLVEVLYAAERMAEIAGDPRLTDPCVRTIPAAQPREGVGVCEAPRGTLFHHYTTDKEGIIQKANLIVATHNNAAAICMSVQKAASAFIKGGVVDDGILAMIEMAFRAYDPCMACATHAIGEMPMRLSIYDSGKVLVREIVRGAP